MLIKIMVTVTNISRYRFFICNRNFNLKLTNFVLVSNGSYMEDILLSDRWQHDKFHVGLLTPEKEEDAKAFGTHWSRIRSERSKERERRSRSSSGGSRRSRNRKPKKRGKSSRSSSYGSRSRSRGRRRRRRS